MISETDKEQFADLLRAAESDKLILMECRRKSDGKVVNLICGAYYEGEEFNLLPYADLLDRSEGDPIDKYQPADPDDPTKFIQDPIIVAKEF